MKTWKYHGIMGLAVYGCTFLIAMSGLVEAQASPSNLGEDSSAMEQSAADFPELIPMELVGDLEPIASSDPYCAACYDESPSKITAQNDTEANITLTCNQAANEILRGTLVLDAVLDDDTVEPVADFAGFVLCGPDSMQFTAELQAGTTWSWSSVDHVVLSVIED